MMQQQATSTFGTLLIKRKTNERPSEWEMALRPICQKIRIVEKLAGGAHLMVAGSPSVAIRVYTANDIANLEGSDISNAGSEIALSLLEEVDGLLNFRDSFEHSILFFVLNNGQLQRDQLGRRESFVSRAQRSLLSRNKDGNDENGKKKRVTRTFIVPDIPQVIETIDSVVQSLNPEKRDKKRKYFSQIANQNYLPNHDETGVAPTKESIANHVSKTFHEWAARFEMPEGDSNVVLSFLGSLGKVATANADTLDEVPIRNATKEMVTRFFGSHSENTTRQAESADPQSVPNPFDSLDDEELLRYSEPIEQTQMQSIQRGSQSDITLQNKRTNQFNSSSMMPQMHHSNNPQGSHSNLNATIGNTNHHSFQGNIDFTPMQTMQPMHQSRPPTRQYQNETGFVGYNANPSIFPESFCPQNQYAPPSSRGGPRQMTSNGYALSPNYPSAQRYHGGRPGTSGGIRRFTSPPGSVRRGQYHPYQNGGGNMNQYQDPTIQGYGGGVQSSLHYTQQFM